MRDAHPKSVYAECSHPYQLDESISNFRIVGWYFSFLFKFKKNNNICMQTVENLIRRCVSHCLSMFHKKDAMLIWLNCVYTLESSCFNLSMGNKLCILGAGIFIEGRIFCE